MTTFQKLSITSTKVVFPLFSDNFERTFTNFILTRYIFKPNKDLKIKFKTWIHAKIWILNSIGMVSLSILRKFYKYPFWKEIFSTTNFVIQKNFVIFCSRIPFLMVGLFLSFKILPLGDEVSYRPLLLPGCVKSIATRMPSQTKLLAALMIINNC